MGNEPNRPVTTVEKSIQLLELIKEEEEISLLDIESKLDMSKSTIHRHLKTLEEHGFVARSDRGYRIGLYTLDFGLHARTQRALFHATKPKVDALAAETEEKVWCITHEQGRSIHLYGASGENSVNTYAQEGQRGYLHQLAAGKAMLSTFSTERIDDIIDMHGLPARTNNTITDRNELLSELEDVSERGYAFNKGESVPGLHAVAAPITASDGTAIGAISISGPSNRMEGEMLTERMPDLLLGSTNEIELNMNYSE